MVRVLCVFLLQFLVFAGGCVREKVDQSLPLPGPPELSHQVERIVVFEFASDETVPSAFKDKVYRYFVEYLIERRKVFVVHPKLVRELVGEASGQVITPKKAEAIATRLSADGFVLGFLANYSLHPRAVAFDATLYPLVNVENPICHGHRYYDTENRLIIGRMKAFAKLFDWKDRPLGYRRVALSEDIFAQFVAWDMVQSFF